MSDRGPVNAPVVLALIAAFIIGSGLLLGPISVLVWPLIFP